MSNGDNNGGFWDKLPTWLQWDILRHARMTDEEGRYHPETGEPLDDLPRGLGRRWESNVEDATGEIKLVPRTKEMEPTS